MSDREPRWSDPPPSGAPLSTPLSQFTIVVADDDRVGREVLVTMLRAHGYTVEAVEDGQQALERAGKGGVDLLLLDVVMPKLTGLEACRLLKSVQRDSFLPVILLTVRSDAASRVEGLKIGADDYVCKPFDEAELLARVEAMLRIKRMHDQVTQAKAKLEQLSLRDELTGLYNYRYLHIRLNEEFKRAERYHEPLACILLDVDRLRDLNERGGRSFGDQVLCGIADAVRRNVREVDVVARFGGDEFLLVLPSTHFAGSATVAERIWRETRDRSVFAQSGRSVEVKVSMGVALFPSRDVRTKDALLRAADTALREAKHDGGDRVCIFQQHGYIYTPVSGDAQHTEEPPEGRPLQRADDGRRLASGDSTRTRTSHEDEPPMTRHSSEPSAKNLGDPASVRRRGAT